MSLWRPFFPEMLAHLKIPKKYAIKGLKNRSDTYSRMWKLVEYNFLPNCTAMSVLVRWIISIHGQSQGMFYKNCCDSLINGKFFAWPPENLQNKTFFFKEVWKKNWLKILLIHWFLMVLSYHRKETTQTSKMLFLTTFRVLYPPEFCL